MNLPENSKIKVTKMEEQLTFELTNRSIKNTLFWLIMTIIWGFTFWGFVTNDAPIVFLIPIGLMMLLSPVTFLFFLVGKRKIIIDPSHFTFEWSLFEVLPKNRTVS